MLHITHTQATARMHISFMLAVIYNRYHVKHIPPISNHFKEFGLMFQLIITQQQEMRRVVARAGGEGIVYTPHEL